MQRVGGLRLARPVWVCDVPSPPTISTAPSHGADAAAPYRGGVVPSLLQPVCRVDGGSWMEMQRVGGCGSPDQSGAATCHPPNDLRRLQPRRPTVSAFVVPASAGLGKGAPSGRKASCLLRIANSGRQNLPLRECSHFRKRTTHLFQDHPVSALQHSFFWNGNPCAAQPCAMQAFQGRSLPFRAALVRTKPLCVRTVLPHRG